MKTLIAVPSHDYVHAEFTKSLMNLEMPPDTGFTMITNTLIYTARTLIMDNAVEMDFDNVLWIDSDMTFKPDALMKLAGDMEQGLDMVCGIYFTRKFPMFPGIQSELHWRIKEDGWVDTGAKCYMDYPKDSLFEVQGCGFGFVMTSVDLLKRMKEKYGSPFYPLMGMGEDTAFCWRVREAGGKIWCDSRVKCGHIGQMEFDEDLYLKARQK